MKKLESTDPRVLKAIELYKSGLAVHPICKELKMDSTTLRKILIEQGALRSRADACQLGKFRLVVNHAALDELTEEACYWIGFLYADGHIEKSRPRISLTLTLEDLPHLERFAKFFGAGIITVKGTGDYKDSVYHRCAFSSSKLYERLKSLGFTNRKTWDITVHPSLKYSKHFWRGVVDGDGWICNTEKSGASIGLSGHENTLKGFITYVNSLGINTKVSPYKDKRREFLWKMDIRGNQIAPKVATLLYKDSTIHLDRKYQKYLELINSPDSCILQN